VAIVEEIQLEGNAEEALAAAADAADELAESASSARDALGDIDASGVDSASDAAESAADEAEGLADAAEEAGDAMADAGDQGSSAFDSVKASMTELNQGLEIAGKAAKAVKAVADVAIAFGKAVVEAHGFREASTAALDQLTGGRGEAALAALGDQAHALGISTKSAVEQFTALREAGASNADAQALISLRADLEAVGVSSGDAEAAVTSALDAIKKGESAESAISRIAQGYGAVGDGANAAAKRALTLTGAIENAKGLGERVFGRIADAAGSSLDEAGAAVTRLFDQFENSGALDTAIQTIASGIRLIPPIIDALGAGLEGFLESAEPGIEALGTAFDALSSALGGSSDGMSVASAIGSALGFVISTIANVIAGAVAAAAAFASMLSALGGAASSASEMVSSALGAIGEIDLASAGTALIQGFIDGILNMAGAVASAAASVASGAADAVAGALGIASPSKVGLELGGNLGESVGTGAEEAMPATIDVPMFGEPANDVGDVMGDAPTGAAASSGGGVSIKIDVVIGGTNASASDIETAIRRAVEDALERAAA
jgi:hypothetical protein